MVVSRWIPGKERRGLVQIAHGSIQWGTQPVHPPALIGMNDIRVAIHPRAIGGSEAASLPGTRTGFSAALHELYPHHRVLDQFPVLGANQAAPVAVVEGSGGGGKEDDGQSRRHRQLAAMRPFDGFLNRAGPPRQDRLAFQKTIDVLRKLPRRHVASQRFLGNGLEHDGFKIDRDRFVEPARRPRLLQGDLVQKHLPVPPLEGRFQRQHLIEGDAKGVDVGAMVDAPPLSEGLLRTHVTQGAHQISGQGQARLGLHPGETEVGDPEVAEVIEDEIPRFHIAVDDADRVGMLERFRGLNAEAGDRTEKSPALRGQVWNGERLSLGAIREDPRGVLGNLAAIPPVPDRFCESAAIDELHGVVVHAALAANGEYRNDVRVVELRRRLRFVLEPLDLLLIEERGKRQDLEGHPSPQGQLLRLVNDTHAAVADLARDAKVPKAGACRAFKRRAPRRAICHRRSSGRLPLPQEAQALDAGPEPLGDTGMAGDELLDVRFSP